MTFLPMAHLAVLLSGMGLGLYLIGGMVVPISPLNAIGIVICAALFIWVIWVAGGRLWFHRDPDMRRSYLNLAAIAYTPLSLLSLRTVFWLTVVKNGTIEWTYNFVNCQRLLFYGVLFGTCALYIITICIARRRFIAEKVVKRQVKSVLFFVVIPVLIYAFAFKPDIHGPIDFFHEGEMLAPAMEIQTGKIPYKETVFLHGLLFDPGQGILSMYLFNPTLMGFRICCAFVDPLLWVVLYFLGYAITGSWAWAFGFSVMGGVLAQFPPHYNFITQRELFACVSLLFLVLYISNKRTSMLVFSGLGAGFSFLWVYSSGITSIAGGTIFLGLYLFFCTDQRGISKVKSFIIYVSAVAIPLFALLVWGIWWGFLKDMIEYNTTLIKIHIIRGGLNFPGLISHLNMALGNLGFLSKVSHGIKFFSEAECGFSYLFILTMILTSFYLSLSLLRGRFVKKEWKFFALLLFSIISFIKTVVTNRSYVLDLSGGFPGFLCFAWCYYFVGQIREAKRTAGMLVPLFGLIFLSGVLFFYYSPGLGRFMHDSRTFPLVPYNFKNRVIIPDHYRRTRIPKLGNLYIPESQAMMVEGLYDYVSGRTSQSETIFDFTNYPLYYFLLERNSPCPYTTTEYIATADQQRKTNQGIENNKTPLIIFYREGSFTAYHQAAWGADFFTRQYLVSEYLMRHYKPAAKIDNNFVVSRGNMSEIDNSWRKAIFNIRELYMLPYVWGKIRKEQIENAAKRVIFWDRYTLRKYLKLRLRQLNLDPWNVTYLKIRTRTVEPARCFVRWKAQGRSSAEGGICFYLKPDNNPHDYIVRLASYPEWMWVGSPIEWLEINAIDNRAGIELIGIEMLKWSEEIGTDEEAGRVTSRVGDIIRKAAGG